MLPTEDVGMSACLEEQQCELVVVLLPSHQPVRLDVALPFPCRSPLMMHILTLDRASHPP